MRNHGNEKNSPEFRNMNTIINLQNRNDKTSLALNYTNKMKIRQWLTMQLTPIDYRNDLLQFGSMIKNNMLLP